MAKCSKRTAKECREYWRMQKAFYNTFATRRDVPDSVRTDALSRVAESEKWLRVIDYVVDKGWPLKEAKAYLAIREPKAPMQWTDVPVGGSHA
jgi:hypothetical protein